MFQPSCLPWGRKRVKYVKKIHEWNRGDFLFAEVCISCTASPYCSIAVSLLKEISTFYKHISRNFI